MMSSELGTHSEPRVLQAGGHSKRAGGNQLLVYTFETGPALLKVYRRRGSRFREFFKRVSYRFIERKCGVTARERCALERANLRLWRDAGFEVPALLDRPLPPGYEPDRAQWLEYCPGPLLHDFVRDSSVPLSERGAAVECFSAALSDRQRRAFEFEERSLVMKHASLKHVLLFENRQVSFDLETVYASTVPMLDALADELGGYARSLLRMGPVEEQVFLGTAFVRAYSNSGLLRKVIDYGLSGGGVVRAVKRFGDERRRPSFSEHAALRWLRDHAEA